jgi:hypothetical protein
MALSAATCFGLYSSGFKPQRGRDFPYPSTPAPRYTQPPEQWAPGPFDRVKWLRHGVNHPPHLVTKLIKGYSYASTLLCASVACYRAKFAIWDGNRTANSPTFLLLHHPFLPILIPFSTYSPPSLSLTHTNATILKQRSTEYIHHSCLFDGGLIRNAT